MGSYSSLLGTAKFPVTSTDTGFMMMASSTMLATPAPNNPAPHGLGWQTFVHEFGHTLGLWHTHHRYSAQNAMWVF